MNTLVPPPERQLPPWRVAELRTRVMAGIDKPARAAPRTRRMVLITAAALAVIAGGATTATMIRTDDATQVLAFGPGVVSPQLEAAVDRCLYWSSPESKDPSDLAHEPQIRVTKDDLVVSAQHGNTSAVAFVTDEGYLTCQYKDGGNGLYRFIPGAEDTGATSMERWAPPQKDWLPGPAQRLLLASTEPHGGDVTVIGRVSTSVRRLVLEYGTGHTSEARFGSGMFALLSDGTPVTKDADLVSFDAAGHEIGRAALFQPRRDDGCFTDPAGNAVYGKADGNCRPAFRWR